MADDYNFTLRGYIDEHSHDQLYDYLKSVYNKARKRFDLESNEEYAFQDQPGRINLLAARGFLMKSMEPIENRNTVWDDTLFVLYIEEGTDEKKVERFQISTEHKIGLGMSLMIRGMHKYKLGHHKVTQTHIEVESLNPDGSRKQEQEVIAGVPQKNDDDTPKMVDAWETVPWPMMDIKAAADYTYAKQRLPNPDYPNTGLSRHPIYRNYRALNPVLDHPAQIVDKDGDLATDPGEGPFEKDPDKWGGGLNIHFGGRREHGPERWSEGCQVILGWSNYKKFIELVESDDTIIGVINNHIKPALSADGTRYVIYTLVEGSFLKPPTVGYPFVDADAESLYKLNESQDGGFYPIGKNRFWHGGIHLKKSSATEVRAVADGTLVAYRLNKDPLKTTINGKEHSYSSSFCLIRHEYVTPNKAKIPFYSLYMHLLNFSAYTGKEEGPIFLAECEFKVQTRQYGGGLNLRDLTVFGTVIAVIPKGVIVVLDKSSQPPPDWAKKWGKSKKCKWAKVTYDGKDGYACYKMGSKTKIKKLPDGTYRCETAEDNPGTGKRGLNVYEGKDENGTVLRVIPTGEIIEFDKSRDVAVDGVLISARWWTTKKDWRKVKGGGWVYVDHTHVKGTVVKIKADKLDEVVQPPEPFPISAGQIVGYPGPYMTQPATVHFEILTGSIDFMKNPAKDKGGKQTLKIPPKTAFKNREKVKNVSSRIVNLPAGSVVQIHSSESWGDYSKVSCQSVVGWSEKIRYEVAKKKFWVDEDLAGLHITKPAPGAAETVFEIEIAKDTEVEMETYHKQYTKVRYTLLLDQQETFSGWIANGDLSDSSASTSTLSGALDKLYEQNPDSYDFSGDAGKNSKELLVDIADDDTDDSVCHDMDGSRWGEIEFEPGKKGWIKRNSVTNLSSYDWPRWVKISESKKFSKDGLCDSKQLIDQVDTDEDGKLEDAEIKACLQKFHELACLHPTEWAPPRNKFERLKKLKVLKKTDYDETIKYINVLQWWSGVSKEVRDELSSATVDGSAAVWHLHPIGFIKHLKDLLKAGTTVAP